MTDRNLPKPTDHDPELGPTRTCPGCEAKGEESVWPVTPEFFYPGYGSCIACVLERRAERAKRAAA